MPNTLADNGVSDLSFTCNRAAQSLTEGVGELQRGSRLPAYVRPGMMLEPLASTPENNRKQNPQDIKSEKKRDGNLKMSKILLERKTKNIFDEQSLSARDEQTNGVILSDAGKAG